MNILSAKSWYTQEIEIGNALNTFTLSLRAIPNGRESVAILLPNCEIAEPVPNEVRNLAPSLLRPEASGLATVSLLAMTLHLMRLY